MSSDNPSISAGAGNELTGLSRRRQRRAVVSTALRDRDPEDLLALEISDEVPNVWSTTGVTYVEDEPVFVKRVPLTAIECSQPYSTRNHFNLPTFYQYGVGSAGFGAFRELAALEAATEWVLSGETTGFPLLHHHCLLPARPSSWRSRMTREDYFRYWASNQEIERMIQARFAADHELWLFMEFVPATVSNWLMPANQGQVDSVIDQVSQAIEVLDRHGFAHFDAHLGNIVTDGTSVYVADFGLAVGRSFELSPAERSFLDVHRHYDLGKAIGSLGLALAQFVHGQSAEARAEIHRACDLNEGSSRTPTITRLVRGCHRVAEIVELAPQFLRALDRFSDVIIYMNDFLGELLSRPEKDVVYSDVEVLARLRAAGLPKPPDDGRQPHSVDGWRR